MSSNVHVHARCASGLRHDSNSFADCERNRLCAPHVHVCKLAKLYPCKRVETESAPCACSLLSLALEVFKCVCSPPIFFNLRDQPASLVWRRCYTYLVGLATRPAQMLKDGWRPATDAPCHRRAKARRSSHGLCMWPHPVTTTAARVRTFRGFSHSSEP